MIIGTLLMIATLVATPTGATTVQSAMEDTTRQTATSSKRDTTLVQGAIYDRPYIRSVGQISIGGYVEGNGSYMVEEGITDGFSFDLRRFNIFIFSSVGPRLSFTSELEFEHGTEEIELETALLDFTVNSALILRAGVFVVPIGAYNQNHDSPRYDFVTRPLVTTEIIPATLSDVGFGLNGRFQLGRAPDLAVESGPTTNLEESAAQSRTVTLTYDAYLSNGLGGNILLGPEERTRIANGKVAGRFGESPTGHPSVSGRVALHSDPVGEIGLSYFGGVYNQRYIDGEEIDTTRRVSIQAIDYSNDLGRLHLRGEIAHARIEIPEPLSELFGSRQWGGYLDLVAPISEPRVLGLRDAVINAALRLEYVDYNVGTFASTGQSIGDEVVAIVPALSFRPAANTVFQLNYRREWARDRLGNRREQTGGVQLGFASYF